MCFQGNFVHPFLCETYYWGVKFLDAFTTKRSKYITIRCYLRIIMSPRKSSPALLPKNTLSTQLMHIECVCSLVCAYVYATGIHLSHSENSTPVSTHHQNLLFLRWWIHDRRPLVLLPLLHRLLPNMGDLSVAADMNDETDSPRVNRLTKMHGTCARTRGTIRSTLVCVCFGSIAFKLPLTRSPPSPSHTLCRTLS